MVTCAFRYKLALGDVKDVTGKMRVVSIVLECDKANPCGATSIINRIDVWWVLSSIER